MSEIKEAEVCDACGTDERDMARLTRERDEAQADRHKARETARKFLRWTRSARADAARLRGALVDAKQWVESARDCLRTMDYQDANDELIRMEEKLDAALAGEGEIAIGVDLGRPGGDATAITFRTGANVETVVVEDPNDALTAVYLKATAEERERCARIAETHPLHPSTHTGERQRWLREGIAGRIREGKDAPEKARQA